MLSQDDRRQLAELERYLRTEDPAFVARMSGPGRRRRRRLLMILACVVIWIATTVAAVLGWWLTAALVCLAAVGCTATLGWMLRQTHP